MEKIDFAKEFGETREYWDAVSAKFSIKEDKNRTWRNSQKVCGNSHCRCIGHGNYYSSSWLESFRRSYSSFESIKYRKF